MHKFDPRKRFVLDDPKRILFENPDQILSEAGVKIGDVVADIGCGTGFFTLPLAPLPFDNGLIGVKLPTHRMDKSNQNISLI